MAAAGAPEDYRADTNGGAGWILRSRWAPMPGEHRGDISTLTYDTLGAAYQQGRQLACCAGIVEVQVMPADSPDEPVAIYARSDNRWRDLDSRIRRFEAYLTDLDWQGQRLRRHRGPLGAEERQTLLRSVAVGGITAASHDHPLCRQLEAEGRLRWDGRRWRPTAAA